MRRLTAVIVAIVPWGLAFFLVWYCDRTGNGAPGTVSRTLNRTVLGSGFLVGFAFWVTSVYRLLSRGKGTFLFITRLNAGLLLIALPLVGIAFVVPQLAFGRRVLTSVRASDGRVYHLSHAGMWENEMGEELARNPLFLTTRVLCRTIVDNPYDQRLIRPARIAQQHGPQFSTAGLGWPHPSASPDWPGIELLFSTNGTKLAAVSKRDPAAAGEKPYVETWLLYDFQGHRGYGYPSLWGAGDIMQISSFILLGPSDEPNPDDVEAICQAMEKGGFMLVPFKDDVRSSNVEVRKALTRVLGYAWRERRTISPWLRKLAADDPVATVRNEATAALKRLQDFATRHKSELSVEEQ